MAMRCPPEEEEAYLETLSPEQRLAVEGAMMSQLSRDDAQDYLQSIPRHERIDNEALMPDELVMGMQRSDEESSDGGSDNERTQFMGDRLCDQVERWVCRN